MSVDMIIAYNNLHKVPTQKISTPKIDLSFKGWQDDKGDSYSPNDVLKNPSKYPDDYDRIVNANLKHPILLTETFIIDGVHRITHAIINGIKSIRAIIVPKNIIKLVGISPQTRERNEGFEFIELFIKRGLLKRR